MEAEIPALLDVLARRRADGIRHAVSSFREHLFQTSRLLDRWGAPPRVTLAGLFHSAYGSDAHDVALFALDERDLVRQLIGEDAERLVYLFCTIERLRLFERLRGDAQVTDVVTAQSWRGPDSPALSPADVADLLLVEIANYAEQAHGGQLRPGIWITRCAEWARTAEACGARPPAPFAGGLALSAADEIAARDIYLQADALQGVQPEAAGALFEEAAQRNPHIGEPLICAAQLTATRGDRAGARELARRGHDRLMTWGTAWDKRTSWRDWIEAADRLTAR